MKIKYKGSKINVYHPTSVEDAINCFQEFLECDLYSKFRPEHIIPLTEKGKKKKVVFYREDIFMNEREFMKYLQNHFDILREEIIKLIGNNQFKNKKINQKVVKKQRTH